MSTQDPLEASSHDISEPRNAVNEYVIADRTCGYRTQPRSLVERVVEVDSQRLATTNGHGSLNREDTHLCFLSFRANGDATQRLTFHSYGTRDGAIS